MKVSPPVGLTVVPVMNRASSETRNKANLALTVTIQMILSFFRKELNGIEKPIWIAAE